MRILDGKTAVITGAGSGFGRAFALRCASEGMHLVLADVNEPGLRETAELLGDTPHITQVCNVAHQSEVASLAEHAYERFGQVHLLFNNAGVAMTGPVWTASLEEWQWGLGVNLMGVVHGLRSFTQRMIDSGEDCHIVNTASAAGVLAVPGSAIYCATKHAVVAISEVLHHELNMLGAKVGVSVLCPAFVNTGIADSDRLRPAEAAKNPHPMTKASEAMTRQAIEKSKVSAEDVARITIDAVRAGQFYIFTHPKIKTMFEARFRNLLEELPPHNSLEAQA